MKHHKIPKSSRHRKIKIQTSLSDDDEVEVTVPIKKDQRIRDLKRVKKMKEQRPPRRVVELFESAQQAQQLKKDKKKPKKTDAIRVITQDPTDEEGCERGVKFLPPVLEQAPYETSEHFVHRLGKMASKAMAEAAIEEKFELDFCPKVDAPQILSTKTGEAVGSSKDKKRKNKRDKKRGKKGKKGISDEERLEKKREKRRLRDARRRGKKKPQSSGALSDEDNDFSRFQDRIAFGETVLEPPAFSKRKFQL